MSRFPSPSLSLACFLALAPVLAVFQFRGIAPLGTVALLAMAAGGLAAGRGPKLPLAAWLALALCGWGLLSALWAVDPGRSALEGARIGALALLGGLAATALGGPQETPRPVLRWLTLGLVAGTLLMFADQTSFHTLRALVRGLRHWDLTLGYGLKPAASVVAVLLPLAVFVQPGARRKIALTLMAVVAIFSMPAQAAKIGVLAGMAGYIAFALLGARVLRLAVPLVVALVLLLPLGLGALLATGPDVNWMQGSAAHRVLIWDFAIQRMLEHPLLGWGMEAARAIPGGELQISAEQLARFHLEPQAAWFAEVRAQRLPLHTHNFIIQIWLELGAVGAALTAALLAVLLRAADHPGRFGAFCAAFAVANLSYGAWQGWWVALLVLLALTAQAVVTPAVVTPAVRPTR